MPTLKLNASDLNKRVTIQREALNPQDNGFELEEWVDVVKNVPAKVQQMTGRKIVASGQEQIQYDHLVTVRWIRSFQFSGVKYRVLYRGQELEIISEPAEIGVRQFMELVCKVMPTR